MQINEQASPAHTFFISSTAYNLLLSKKRKDTLAILKPLSVRWFSLPFRSRCGVSWIVSTASHQCLHRVSCPSVTWSCTNLMVSLWKISEPRFLFVWSIWLHSKGSRSNQGKTCRHSLILKGRSVRTSSKSCISRQRMTHLSRAHGRWETQRFATFSR